ncbi:hypothetical protein Taro_051194 [Colocasia esculenta]|uniref:Uncharacterized protein n=1 Tax=Colocasia esculenta TaxID=4460 RepID=A0A843XFW5_COLES|nr:hypothetical protein [Colocasia esculenta]
MSRRDFKSQSFWSVSTCPWGVSTHCPRLAKQLLWEGSLVLTLHHLVSTHCRQSSKQAFWELPLVSTLLHLVSTCSIDWNFFFLARIRCNLLESIASSFSLSSTLSLSSELASDRWILSLSKRLALIPLVAQLTSPNGG